MMSWERLEKIIEWAGMSTHAFAIRIGMKRSENLYRIIRNKENVSIKLATQMLEAYPQVSKNWLIYGEGEMLVKDLDAVDLSCKIPYFATSVDGIDNDIVNLKPTYNMYIPLFKDADLAITMSDKAMEPSIPMGAMIILKSQMTDIIMYGHTYYLEIGDLKMVRIVRKCETSEDYVTLQVVNTERYDNITIKKDTIKSLYLVYGVLNRLF